MNKNGLFLKYCIILSHFLNKKKSYIITYINILFNIRKFRMANVLSYLEFHPNKLEIYGPQLVEVNFINRSHSFRNIQSDVQNNEIESFMGGLLHPHVVAKLKKNSGSVIQILCCSTICVYSNFLSAFEALSNSY